MDEHTYLHQVNDNLTLESLRCKNSSMIALDFFSSSSSDKAGLEGAAVTATGAGVSRLTKQKDMTNVLIATIGTNQEEHMPHKYYKKNISSSIMLYLLSLLRSRGSVILATFRTASCGICATLSLLRSSVSLLKLLFVSTARDRSERSDLSKRSGLSNLSRLSNRSPLSFSERSRLELPLQKRSS